MHRHYTLHQEKTNNKHDFSQVPCTLTLRAKYSQTRAVLSDNAKVNYNNGNHKYLKFCIMKSLLQEKMYLCHQLLAPQLYSFLDYHLQPTMLSCMNMLQTSLKGDKTSDVYIYTSSV